MRYDLMHKKIKVAELSIDDYGNISSVDKIISPEHFPLGTYTKDKADRHELNKWWLGRSIPASRKGLNETLEKLGECNIMTLVLKSYGLSLSDHYWVKPENSDVSWEKVNFFDNDFSEDIGNILLGGDLPVKVDFNSPDNTSDGNLKKRWKIIDGDRCLLKGGSNPFQQEPFNEVIASDLMKRLGIDCVSYNVVWQEGYPYSVCTDFINKDTELITAVRLMKMKKKPNHISTYRHFISCCEDIGLNAITFLDKMLTIDYIIANEDRHFNNFGVIRNPETLKYIGFAPIYDSGTSLCYNRNAMQFDQFETKPFKNDCDNQLKLVKSFDWFSEKNVDFQVNEIIQNLSELVNRGFTSMERVERLAYFVRERYEYIIGVSGKQEYYIERYDEYDEES